jgi:hypothetical protein
MLALSQYHARAPVKRRSRAYFDTRTGAGTFRHLWRFIVTSRPGGDDETTRECHVSGRFNCGSRSKRSVRAKHNATTGQHFGKTGSSSGFSWRGHGLEEPGRDWLDWRHPGRDRNDRKECRRASLEIRRGSGKRPAFDGYRRGPQRSAEAIPGRENTGIATWPRLDRVASADWAIRGLPLC